MPDFHPCQVLLCGSFIFIVFTCEDRRLHPWPIDVRLPPLSGTPLCILHLHRVLHRGRTVALLAYSYMSNVWQDIAWCKAGDACESSAVGRNHGDMHGKHILAARQPKSGTCMQAFIVWTSWTAPCHRWPTVTRLASFLPGGRADVRRQVSEPGDFANVIITFEPHIIVASGVVAPAREAS